MVSMIQLASDWLDSFMKMPDSHPPIQPVKEGVDERIAKVVAKQSPLDADFIDLCCDKEVELIIQLHRAPTAMEVEDAVHADRMNHVPLEFTRPRVEKRALPKKQVSILVGLKANPDAVPSCEDRESPQNVKRPKKDFPVEQTSTFYEGKEPNP